MTPVLAPALVQLRAQIDAAFPTRSKLSDGWLGDARHQAEGDASVSQHNPNAADVVCAIDVTEDLSVGLDCNRLMDELDASNDPRIFYLIHDRQIDNSDDSRTPYYGVNPHTKHLHISTWWNLASLYNDARPWRIPMLGGGGPTALVRPPRATVPPAPALPRWSLPTGHYYGLISGPAKSHGGFYPAERPAIQAIQRRLVAKGYVTGVRDWRSPWCDGRFEQPTADAVARFQRVEMPGTQFYGQVWGDDYARLAR